MIKAVKHFEVVQGTVDVELDGDQSSFDFEFLDEGGNEIKGFFKGILEEI